MEVTDLSTVSFKSKIVIDCWHEIFNTDLGDGRPKLEAFFVGVRRKYSLPIVKVDIPWISVPSNLFPYSAPLCSHLNWVCKQQTQQSTEFSTNNMSMCLLRTRSSKLTVRSPLKIGRLWPKRREKRLPTILQGRGCFGEFRILCNATLRALL